jgi:hypothetical protein
MEQNFDISRLLLLRKLTNALSEYFAKQLSDYLASLAPLLNPKSLLGDFIRGEKASVKGADAAFQELHKLFQQVAPQRPFQISLEIKPPLDIFGFTPAISPVSYLYTPEGNNKKITIRSPFKWVLSYKDLNPQRLRELIADHARTGGSELQSALLHYLVIHVVTSKHSGIAPILAALRFPITSGSHDEFGQLPLTYICSPLSTIRASDEIISQITELSGTDTFDEVINLEDIAKLSDPFADRIFAIVQEHAESLLSEVRLSQQKV